MDRSLRQWGERSALEYLFFFFFKPLPTPQSLATSETKIFLFFFFFFFFSFFSVVKTPTLSICSPVPLSSSPCIPLSDSLRFFSTKTKNETRISRLLLLLPRTPAPAAASPSLPRPAAAAARGGSEEGSGPFPGLDGGRSRRTGRARRWRVPEGSTRGERAVLFFWRKGWRKERKVKKLNLDDG